MRRVQEVAGRLRGAAAYMAELGKAQRSKAPLDQVRTGAVCALPLMGL